MNRRLVHLIRTMALLCGALLASAACSQEVLVQQYRGNGTLNTRPFTVAQGWEVQWNASGDIFQLFLYDGAGDLVEVAANQQGSGIGASFFPKRGTFYFQVNAIGTWSMRIIEIAGAPPRVGSNPRVLQGNGTSNTRPFVVLGPWEVQWNATGDVFQVFVYDSGGQLVEIAANQLGAGSGASYQPRPGTYYLQVNSMGNWTVRIVALD